MDDFDTNLLPSQNLNMILSALVFVGFLYHVFFFLSLTHGSISYFADSSKSLCRFFAGSFVVRSAIRTDSLCLRVLASTDPIVEMMSYVAA